MSANVPEAVVDGSGLPWQRHVIDDSATGADEVKFDLTQVLDLDADGDLDVITCEEVADLGVIWYENPARQSE